MRPGDEIKQLMLWLTSTDGDVEEGPGEKAVLLVLLPGPPPPGVKGRVVSEEDEMAAVTVAGAEMAGVEAAVVSANLARSPRPESWPVEPVAPVADSETPLERTAI